MLVQEHRVGTLCTSMLAEEDAMHRHQSRQLGLILYLGSAWPIPGFPGEYLQGEAALMTAAS